MNGVESRRLLTLSCERSRDSLLRQGVVRARRGLIGSCATRLAAALATTGAVAQEWDYSRGTVTLSWSSTNCLPAPNCCATWNGMALLGPSDDWTGMAHSGQASPQACDCRNYGGYCLDGEWTPLVGAWARSTLGSFGVAIQGNSGADGCDAYGASSGHAALAFATTEPAVLRVRINTVATDPYPYGGDRGIWGGVGKFALLRGGAPLEPLLSIELGPGDLHAQGSGPTFIPLQRAASLSLAPGSFEVLLEGDGSSMSGCADWADGSFAIQFKVSSVLSDCESDLEGSGEIDGADLSLLLMDWGNCPSCQSDLNWDLSVDGADLSQMLLDWGPCIGQATALEHSPSVTDRPANATSPNP